jgi:hypothetical protein
MDDDLDQLKAEEKERAQNDSPTRNAEPRDDHNNGWIGGVILIGIGVVFLLGNFTDLDLTNWWAVFILIPALTILGNALRTYRKEKRLTREVVNPLVGGLMMLFVATIFLFDLDWGNVWPGFIIIAGVGALLNAFAANGE